MTAKSRPPRFTNAHLRQLKTASRGNRGDAAELFEEFRTLPRKRREAWLGADLWWSWVYELTMVQHTALWLATIGLLGELKGIMEGAGDKAQALFDFAKNYEPDDADVNKIFGPEADETQKALVSSLFIALLLQIECLENKGCYLSELVAKVSNGEDVGDASFFHALQIDRTIVSCPTFGARISRAALEGDEVFFKSLAGNMKKQRKNNSPKKLEMHNDLRLMLQATHEDGTLGGMSMTEADKLFIQELSVYPNDGEDPARGLQRFILRWKNNK